MSARFQIKDDNIIYFSNIDKRRLAFAEKVTNKKVSFDIGKYNMEVPSSTLPAIVVNLEAGFLSFKGCNSVTVNYEAYSDGTIVFTPGISTLIACPVDNDSKYVAALLSAESFEKSPTNGYVLKNE